MAKLSVIIPAKNEEVVIKDCLESVNWVDEVIVIDNNSSDRTVEIAREFKVNIYKYAKGNYSDRRNFGLKFAHGEWVLFLDADERITPLLRSEILKIITDEKLQMSNSAYAIPRKNIIFGKEFKHGGWWPDYNKRLFKKDSFEKWEGELHEEPIFRGILGHLINPMTHFKNMTMAEMVDKTNKWSEAEAKLMFEAGHPPMNIIRFTTAVFREFWLRGVKQRAFIDGFEGTIYAVYQIFSRFVSYAKLWELQVKRHNEGSNL
ncbi:hypothetical protein A2961_03450 [Candidatus Woesebacteria bacterium RIFCSPLOWO2_01_FULL_39_21]|uniref:Glycosyltransferase 2-like domain-containing protein n=1 Tax=Candidatus Woesebacteria bacterium RIFCSPLOWO2_01_FULL_39_21 TaxID=1802519 RepID=A0A1F8BGF2_9BACT|nr:MAG: hypothetical protein A2961_03450 [Candidatus Woesebacteria bacterium RIFCSPLOWO2_01_FULL_39_21]